MLTVNAGSSTLKLTLLDRDDQVLATRKLEAPGGAVQRDQLNAALAEGLAEPDAVGHRIVHGGDRFRSAVRIDNDVESALRELVDLAPLHQPKSLAALDAVSAAMPGVPAVACFDTAFHATLPAAAHTYALPAPWRTRWGIRRYGFHGLSHAWIACRAPELLRSPRASLRIVSCHLGAGASLCAVVNGRSLDTTMGFTPLEGLVMATRSGSVDPGALLWLLERADMSEREIATALEHESGLLGLGGSADMRELLTRAESGDDEAGLAVEVYIHRLRAGIAAMAASLGGLDVLAFTGGVGERSPAIRSRAVNGLTFLGVGIDDGRNADVDADAEITPPHAEAHTLVIRSREDLEIARQVRDVLARGRSS